MMHLSRFKRTMLLKRGLWVGFCFTVLCGFTLFTANGTFYKWNVSNGDTVQFILNPSDCDCDLTEEEITTIFRTSMGRWNDVRDSFFVLEDLAEVSPELFEEDPTLSASTPVFDDGINVIGFSDEVPAPFAGFARFNVEGNHIVEADIYLGRGIGFNAKTLESTVTHEFGHVLGLGHDHADVASIMSYGRDSEILRLGVDDIIGAVILYPLSGKEPKPDLGCTTIAPLGPDTPFFDQALLGFLFFITLIGLLLSLMKRWQKAKAQSSGRPSFWKSFVKGSLLGGAVLLLAVACAESFEEHPADMPPEMFAHLEKQGNFIDLRTLKASQNSGASEQVLYFEKIELPRKTEETSPGAIIDKNDLNDLTKPLLNGNKVTFFCPKGW